MLLDTRPQKHVKGDMLMSLTAAFALLSLGYFVHNTLASASISVVVVLLLLSSIAIVLLLSCICVFKFNDSSFPLFLFSSSNTCK